MKIHDLGELMVGNSLWILSKELGQDGSPIKQAGMTSIQMKVVAQDGTKIAERNLTIADCVFDSYRRDGRWLIDREGYNFAVGTLASDVTEIGETVQFRIKFTPTSGQPWTSVYQVLGIGPGWSPPA